MPYQLKLKCPQNDLDCNIPSCWHLISRPTREASLPLDLTGLSPHMLAPGALSHRAAFQLGQHRSSPLLQRASCLLLPAQGTSLAAAPHLEVHSRHSSSSTRARSVAAAAGAAAVPYVSFGEVDQFNFWVYLEMAESPLSETTKDLVGEALAAWYTIGKLGGYNSMNLQVSENTNVTLTGFRYKSNLDEDSLGAFFHEMSDLEDRGSWLRCRFDMGTADELAVDILLNSLLVLSAEYCEIRSIYFTGPTFGPWKGDPARGAGG